MKILIRTLTLFALACLIALPVGAQDSGPIQPARDTTALARRLLGFTAPFAIPLPSPIYHPGDRTQFWVSKRDSQTPTKVTATLLAATDNFYLWVEDSVSYANADLNKMATGLEKLLTLMRAKETYGAIAAAPGIGVLTDPANALTLPDVDHDPHLYVLFASNLANDQSAYSNPNDGLPAEVAPGGYSNQHELILVNTTPYPNVALDDGFYQNLLAESVYTLIMNYQNPDQAPWLQNALMNYLPYHLQQAAVSSDYTTAFFDAPNTPLTQPATNVNPLQATGAQLMFLNYVEQRYGTAVLNDLYLQPGDGLAALNTVLSANQVTDPVTGAPVTAADAFADFSMTNALNALFGDGRYFYSLTPLKPGQVAAAQSFDNPANASVSGQTVNQYGTYYMRVLASASTTLTLNFHGNATVARLPMPPDHDPEDHFYWSGDGWNNDSTLTRAFDLSGVASATLTFDAWHDLPDQWDYAYVEVSTDNGQTWKILPADGATRANLYGLAYGPGLTGVSNPQPPHPFPILGVNLGPDEITITDVAPGSAAEQAGIQKDDVVIGTDNQPWPSLSNVLTLLSQHVPGDMVNLYVQRGSDRLTIPVTLAASPTRRVLPPPLWLSKRLDLTPYAGKQILIRFEYIGVPGEESHGFAVDNIAVPEIGFLDNAEAGIPGWTLDGWQQTDNQLRQRFLVQIATLSSTQAVTRSLISPEDTATDGQWRVGISSGELMIVAVSGLNENTDQPATFDLTVSPAN